MTARFAIRLLEHILDSLVESGACSPKSGWPMRCAPKGLALIHFTWDMHAALANYDLETSWKESIFEESRRRRDPTARNRRRLS